VSSSSTSKSAITSSPLKFPSLLRIAVVSKDYILLSWSWTIHSTKTS
jgi:hypothetical protein